MKMEQVFYNSRKVDGAEIINNVLDVLAHEVGRLLEEIRNDPRFPEIKPSAIYTVTLRIQEG